MLITDADAKDRDDELEIMNEMLDGLADVEDVSEEADESETEEAADDAPENEAENSRSDDGGESADDTEDASDDMAEGETEADESESDDDSEEVSDKYYDMLAQVIEMLNDLNEKVAALDKLSDLFVDGGGIIREDNIETVDDAIQEIADDVEDEIYPDELDLLL